MFSIMINKAMISSKKTILFYDVYNNKGKLISSFETMKELLAWLNK